MHTDYIWLHEATGNNPRAWLSRVETLIQAARMIRQPTPITRPPPSATELMLATDGVYAMLLGYAFECALKGLWLTSGQKIVVNGKVKRVDGVTER
jgi:hypothetical protein